MALGRVWVRKEGRVVEPGLLAVLLPSCCLDIRLEMSKNFRKKDYFWQMMSQQNMFKSKLKAKYFHGEFSTRGL